MRSATILFAAVLFLMLIVVSAAAWRQPALIDAPVARLTERRLSINHANADTLRVLPGIGRRMAVRIVEYRQEHGPYRTVDDLVAVPGVGHKTVRRLTPWIHVAADDRER